MKTTGATVETYQMYSNNGRPIRKATKVVYADGREVTFMDRLPKGAAIRQAQQFLDREGAR